MLDILLAQVDDLIRCQIIRGSRRVRLRSAAVSGVEDVDFLLQPERVDLIDRIIQQVAKEIGLLSREKDRVASDPAPGGCLIVAGAELRQLAVPVVESSGK